MDNSLKIKHLAIKFTGIVIALFILIMAFSSMLNIISFQKVSTEVYVNSSNLNTSGAIQKIQYSLSFGKTIEKFFGMNDVLNEVKNLSSDIKSVSIVKKDGTSLYSTSTDLLNIPQGLEDGKYIESENSIYTKISISDDASIVLTLKNDYIQESVGKYSQSVIMVDLIILAITIAVSLLVYWILKMLTRSKITLKHLKIAGTLILSITQLVFGLYLMNNYLAEYNNSLKTIATTVSNIVEKDIERIVSNGIPMDEFENFDDYLNALVVNIPEIESITVSQNAEENTISTPITILDNLYFINVNCHVNQETVNKKTTDFILDSLILVLVSVIIAFESSFFIGGLVGNADEEKKRKQMKLHHNINFNGVRIWFFLAYLAFSLDSSFLAVTSYKIFTNFNKTGLPESISGLPISLATVFAGLGILITGNIVKKIGIKNLMFTGIFTSILGYIGSSIFSGFYLFIVSRCLVGFGIACILTSGRICSTAQKTSEDRSKFLALLSAGALSGTSCGVVIGGLLVDRLSSSVVFLISAIILVLCIPFLSITNIKKNMEISSPSIKSIVKSLYRPPLSAIYIILLIIPIYIAGQFVSYSIPLYGNEIQTSQTIISAMIMGNYLLSAYLSNPASKFSLRFLGAKKSTLLYCICIITAISLFIVGNSLIYAIISVLLLGIADSFGLIVIVEYFYGIQKDSSDVTTSMLTLLLASKIGSAIAPTLISMGASRGMASSSISLVGILIGGTVLFVILSLFLKKKNKALTKS